MRAPTTEIGLILEGGGMRAGFVAGALMALADHGVTTFDEALAVSASVPTLAYFVAGQRIEMEKVWREDLNTARLVRYRNIPAASIALSVKRPILDIDYLIYDVFRKKYPLDVSRLRASRTTCRFWEGLGFQRHVVFPHLLVKQGPVDPQQLGRLRLVKARRLEGMADRLLFGGPLHKPQGGVRRIHCAPPFAVEIRGQVTQINGFPIRGINDSLENVRHLPDISRPVVVRQNLLNLGIHAHLSQA